MFSRSETTEDVLDTFEEPSGQRSPLMLAGLAGLLAIAGAFLLVWYLGNNGDGEVASTPEVTADGTPILPEATDGNSDAATRQVLVVTQQIPRGTSVGDLIANPTVYLSARAVPAEFVTDSALTSVAELQELQGLVLASDALPGEQLLRGRFRDPSGFDADGQTFLESESGFEIPTGHHAVVIEVPANRAMGGNIRAGELVTVAGNMRITPDADSRAGREVSVVFLNEVEVLSIQSTAEVAGAFAQDFNQVGTATLGSFTITLAVEPEELTDLTFALGYADIVLATAVQGLENDGPRAVTTPRQVLGDDGVWLAELEDGNLVELAELYLPEDTENEQGSSIEVDLATEDDEGDESAAGDAAPADAVQDDPEAQLLDGENEG